MRVLLATPPINHVSGPYPATAYLTGYLRSLGHSTAQADLGLELLLDVLSKRGLLEIRDVILKQNASKRSRSVESFLKSFAAYRESIEPVVRFLQGAEPTLALRIANRRFLPEGPRFDPFARHSEFLLSMFGSLGIHDRAKYLASLFVEDIGDVIHGAIDPDFELARYAESLASSQESFSPLLAKLERPLTMLDHTLQRLWQRHLEVHRPEVIGLSVPFPGNVYGALRMARFARELLPEVKIVLGGGFVSTELRDVSDPRLFDWIDALVYDDGEVPLRQLCSYFSKRFKEDELVRTRLRSGYFHNAKIADTPQAERPRPVYEGLPLQRYLSILDIPNAMNRLWSEFRWNKLILAHGCYWKRCTFCDIHLDYIGRYEPDDVNRLIDAMVEIQAETGSSGFHFVDEAAPPAILRALSKEIIRRGLKFVWWGNLRFDRQFDDELCRLMAQAGCVAVTGGLEVASPRVLKLIDKGVTIEQVAQVTRSFSRNGILVHAYLIYGFPSQTVQETVDSLEIVRQLFAHGCIQSAAWHRFMATVHSPVGRSPERFGISLHPPMPPKSGLFARYSVPFQDSTGIDHDELGKGLWNALYNYMHGVGFREDVRTWFPMKVPRTQVRKGWLKSCLTS